MLGIFAFAAHCEIALLMLWFSELLCVGGLLNRKLGI